MIDTDVAELSCIYSKVVIITNRARKIGSPRPRGYAVLTSRLHSYIIWEMRRLLTIQGEV